MWHSITAVVECFAASTVYQLGGVAILIRVIWIILAGRDKSIPSDIVLSNKY